MQGYFKYLISSYGRSDLKTLVYSHGIVKGQSSKISDIAWEVMESAYANDHNGEKPIGYEQMYEWIHTKMDGENEEAMEAAIQQEKVVDIFLGGKINGVNNELVDISVNSFEIKGVGRELSPEDEQYFKDLIKDKDYNKLLRGSDDHGNIFRASVNVEFDEGVAGHWWYESEVTILGHIEAFKARGNTENCEINDNR